MLVERCPSPEAFLEVTTTYRTNDPIGTNVLGSVALTVIRAPQLYDEYWWWVVRDDDRQVLGAALRTSPFGLLLGPMPDEGARLLAQSVREVDDDFPGVNGPRGAVAALLASYANTGSVGARRRAFAGRTSLVYEVTTLTAPHVKGEMITATRDDLELVERWNDDFHIFVDGVAPSARSPRGASIYAKIESGAVRLWCVKGRPVSMAAHAEPVETPAGSVTRIGPVFTPEKRRGRGYGSAITAALSGELLGRGSRVMLYADADNPTSNGVYQRLGFQQLDAVVIYNFDAPSAH